MHLFTFDRVLAQVVPSLGKDRMYTALAVEGMRERLASLAKKGEEIHIVTPQSGPAWRLIVGEGPNFHPHTVAQVCDRLTAVGHALKLEEAHWWIATWDDRLWKDVPKRLQISAYAIATGNASQEEQEKLLKLEKRLLAMDQEFEQRFLDAGFKNVHASHEGVWRFPGTAMLETTIGETPYQEVTMIGHPDNAAEVTAARLLGINFLSHEEFRKQEIFS